MPGTPRGGGADPLSKAHAGPDGSSFEPESRRPSRLRRWGGRLGILAGICLLIGGLGLGSAEYYTSRPVFCGSCHVMDPYYDSWSHDVHGVKVGAKCVDCHYAPGERFTIKAKFKGLSQVASYFSGRYGAGRPRAHVSDESCLTSGCHGDQAYASRTLLIGKSGVEQRLVGGQTVEVQRTPSVHFVHGKHLNVDTTRQEIEGEIAATRGRIAAAAGSATVERIDAIAGSVGPAAGRETAMVRLAVDLGLADEVRKDALALMALEHRRIRVDQLSGLNCSACHAFNATKQSHIAVDRQVCFTCHFANEEFNRNTGECLRCHEPPRRAISVHANAMQTAAPVMMDHNDVVKRGVNCVSCHLDVVRGEARVSERECTHCHDQAHFMEGFAARTTETVRQYHAAHVANQRAHCFDCHRAVQHGLLDPSAPLAQSGGFLEPVLSDCQHCHENHHAEQVSLLTGHGGAGIEHPLPNAMIGSRLNCRACHTQPGDDAKGDAVIRATRESCATCHSDEYAQMFDSWKHEIDSYLSETEATLGRVEKAAAAEGKEASEPNRVDVLLAAARQNIALVRTGGGLHNRAFALQLLDAARQQLTEAEALLPHP